MRYSAKKTGKIYRGVYTDALSREIRVRPGAKNSKITRKWHKNNFFEKNETYIKQGGELSIPTNFYENWARFGDRMTKKPKKPIFDPAAKMNGANWRFGTLTLTLDDVLCMYIHDKGSIYANKQKIGQKYIWVENPEGGQICPPHPS